MKTDNKLLSTTADNSAPSRRAAVRAFLTEAFDHEFFETMAIALPIAAILFAVFVYCMTHLPPQKPYFMEILGW